MIEDTENVSMASMCPHVELCAYVYQVYEDQEVERGWPRSQTQLKVSMLLGPRSHGSFVGRDFPVFAQNRSGQNSLLHRSQQDPAPVSAR